MKLTIEFMGVLYIAGKDVLLDDAAPVTEECDI